MGDKFFEDLEIMLIRAKIVDSLMGDLKKSSKMKVLKVLQAKVFELEKDKDKNFVALEEIKIFLANNF